MTLYRYATDRAQCDPRGEAKNAKSMAAQWWSMSPREKSIAISYRDDADYFDGNGLPKDFSKDIWKASCKWQRKMRAGNVQIIAKLGERMEVPLTDGTQWYGENDHDQGIAIIVDDEDELEGTDSIVDELSQQIQAKVEGMQKELDEKDDIATITKRRKQGCV